MNSACEKCGSTPSVHAQAHVEFGDLSACVDDTLADLILACWKAGIRTDESCQDHDPDEGYVVFLSFDTTGDYVSFGQRVLKNAPRNDLTERIFGIPSEAAYTVYTTDKPARKIENRWRWECMPIDCGEDSDDETEFLSCVVFPFSDLIEVTRRIEVLDS